MPVGHVAGDLIQDLADEVKKQPGVLQTFGRRELPRAKKGSIFVGAGDSHAAALAGFYATRGRCLALDPYVLASTPEFADGAEAYFISVSGRTSSNVLAASRVKGHAKGTTALTADPDSRLAGVTDRVIKLPMEYRPRTAGMLSFSLCLSAVLRIVGADGPCDFGGALRAAAGRGLGFARGDGTTYFLGNSMAHPAALYASAKTYEVLGARAHGELLEEFSHLELFSLGKQDAVNGFDCFDPSGMARKMSRALAKGGYESRVLRSWGRSPAERLFHAVFQVQLSVLAEARRRRLTAPRFLSAGGALEASDEMIY